MRLIVAEKPSVAIDIARALGTPQKHDGYVTVGPDTITWAYGHLVTLANPEQYDPTWKSWAWATLPMLPDRFQLAPIPDRVAQLRIVTGLMKQATRIVAATDADREGELIFRYIYRMAKVKIPVDRLWLSENTVPAIRTALAAMKPAQAYDALAQAAQARAQADWLVGMNATRAISLRHGQPGQPLSVGRVQTPTLRLIVDRDEAIAQFVATPYWMVEAEFAHATAGSYTGIWQGPDPEHPARLPEAQGKAIVAQLPPGTPGQITQIETKNVLVKPPFFFNLNDLQKEANRRLGLTAQETLDAAQHLYDQHLTSYPRTEARVITQEVAKTVGSRLRILTGPLASLAGQARASLAQRLPRVVNDAAVGQAGHYAIIPTGHPPSSPLSPRDQAVYDLIGRRFLAALLPPGKDARTVLWTVAAGHRFKTTGTVMLDPGWRAAYTPVADPDASGSTSVKEDADADVAIPPGLRVKDAITVAQATVLAKKTKPPARFTDAGLLTLLEKYSLGTPATRARILEVLLARGYIRREKKALVSTDKGQHLLRVVPDLLQSPDLTGDWEQRLEAMTAGSGDMPGFQAEIRQLAQDVVAHAQGQTRDATVAAAPTASKRAHATATLGSCPVCHTGVVQPSAKGWGCSRWKEGCRFMLWKTVAGKRLTVSQVKVLLAGKTTALIQGFQSKVGKAFDAQLRWDASTGRVAFEFPPRTASPGHSTQTQKGR